MSFLRQTALLLPSAFLAGVLFFLVTHGRTDPGFGAYPFFEEWAEGRGITLTPEGRFVAQAAVFFLPAYAVTLLFVLGIALAERALLGAPAPRSDSRLRETFSVVYAVLLLVGTVVVIWIGGRLGARDAPDALLAPVLAAFAPWPAAALAVPAAFLLAGPIALVRKAYPG
ncbi:MAG TPA: hypothetical protein VIA29_09495 [Thermoanaerobaculia bacterium]